jgi:hypothetical protein
MPAVSKKQERFMQAVANNPKFAKKAGVPQSVGKEFTKSGGGMAKANPFMEMIAKKKAAAAGKKPMKKMAGGGLAAGHKAADGVATKGKTKAAMPKMVGAKGMKYGGKC